MNEKDLELLIENFPLVESHYKRDPKNPGFVYIDESKTNYVNRYQEEAYWLLMNGNVILEALCNYFEGKKPNG